MWTHNLHTICKYNQDVSISDIPSIVSKANLGAYIGVAKTNAYWNIPLQYDNLNHTNAQCLLIFTSLGLLCALIDTSDENDNASTIFTGITGFIPSRHIINYSITYQKVLGVNFIKPTPIINIETPSRIYTFKYTLNHESIFYNLSSEMINALYYYKSSSFNTITEGNFFDLGDDPSFAGIENHIINMKQCFGNNTNYTHDQLVKVKVNYVPNFRNNIFSDCIRIPQYFLASFTSTNILLLKLSTHGTYDLFLTNKNLNIPRNSLVNEALYNPSPKQKWTILVTPSFIITLFTPKKVKPLYTRILPYSDALTHYVSNQDPVLVPKLSYHLFIKKELKVIGKEYNANKSPLQKAKLFINVQNILDAAYIVLWLAVFVMYIWSRINGIILHLQTNGLSGNVLTGMLISFISCSYCCSIWYTYSKTQAISSLVPWIATIITSISTLITIFMYLY